MSTLKKPEQSRSLLDINDELAVLLKRRGAEPELPLKTLGELNNKIWGLRRGQLHVVGARTSHGKSSFCLQIARDLSNQNFGVVYLSLEMSAVQCLERLLCQEYKIKNTDLLTGKWCRYTNDMAEFKAKIEHWRLMINDCVGRTWREIDTIITNLKTKPDLVVVDHVQMTRQSTDSGKRELDEYIKNFREIAMRENFAAILVSQINRLSQESETKEPRMHNLKGTGALEEIADVCILLYWPYLYTNNALDFNKYKLFISKNRSGPTGYCDLYFAPENYTFYDKEKQEELI